MRRNISKFSKLTHLKYCEITFCPSNPDEINYLQKRDSSRKKEEHVPVDKKNSKLEKCLFFNRMIFARPLEKA